MERYSYSEEIYRSNVVFGEFDSDSIRSMFTQIFEFYNPKVKDQVFDSFCEDFYNLVKEMHTTNEQVWRMLITDMLFHYDEKGYLVTTASDNKIKRKQFAIIANAITSRLRAEN